MPFRALLYTVVTVTLALVAVGLWVSAVRPMLAQPSQYAARPTHAPDGSVVTPDRSLHLLVKGTMMLAFLLVVVLLAIGLVVTLRQWLGLGRLKNPPAKTPYTDTWKLAGERMPVPPPKPSPDEESDTA